MKYPDENTPGLFFGSFTVKVADTAAERERAAGWLEAEHFLGKFQPVGDSLVQILYEDERPVAVLQWAACAYHLKDREAWIGWDKLTCARRRKLVVNNVRFLVREAERRPNLASQSLGLALRALSAQWRERFGYEPLLAETFTDIESHAGTCYKAAGWTPLGLTQGNARQRSEFYVPNARPKKLWVRPLRPDARERLCAREISPEHAAAQTEGKGAPAPLTLKHLMPMAQALRAVPDPRARNRFHPISALLVCLSVGLLCGATNLNAIVRAAGRLTQAQRRELGLRARRGQSAVAIPNYEVFRDLLLRLDVEKLAGVLSGWLGAHRGSLPAHLAVDGKTIRAALGNIVTLCDIEQKVPVALGVAKDKGGEQAATRELLRGEDTNLLNATVSLDALYTNDENARLIVQEKGGDYLISLKNNQPKLAAHVEAQLQGEPPFCPRPRLATAR